MAEYSNTRREVITLQPVGQIVPCLFAVLRASTFYMVQCEKLSSFFTAAFTFAPISYDTLFPKEPILFRYRFLISFSPTLIGGLPASFHPGDGVVASFPVVFYFFFLQKSFTSVSTTTGTVLRNCSPASTIFCLRFSRSCST